MHGMLLFIKRLTRLCLQSLHHRFRDWTKPDTAPSLIVGTLTDLARSKSELVAENALFWLLVASIGQNSPVRTLKLSLAPCGFPGGRVQLQALIHTSSPRGNGHCAWDCHLHEAVDRRLSSIAPPPLRHLDQTGYLLTLALDADRPCQE